MASRWSPGGAGFGWRSRTTCDYERIVAHDGGVDGFSAAVAFAPDRGFGFVVLTNALDTPVDVLIDQLFDDAVDIEPRREASDPALLALVDRVARAYAECRDDDYAEIFAASFRGAIPLPHYRATCERMRNTHGACSLVRTISVDGAHSGVFDLACERGRIHLTATVSEEGSTKRLSGLLVESTGFAPTQALLRAATDVARLTAKWDVAGAKSLFTPEALASVQRGFERARPRLGACAVARTAPSSRQSPDDEAIVPLTCERGEPTDLAIELAAGKVSSAVLRPRVRRGRCAPAEE